MAGGASLIAAWPYISKYTGIGKKSDALPHDHVKSLIDYFTGKKCKKGVELTIAVGKMLYEDCDIHEDQTAPK